MQRFRRGDQVWGLRDDGTWALWDRRSLTWLPQATPPPREELEELVTKELKVDQLTRALQHRRPTWARESRAQRSRAANVVMGMIIAAVLVGGIFVLLWLLDMFL